MNQSRENLKRLLRPRHIAYIGGESGAPGIAGALAGGFDGPVWSVNPKRRSVAGLPCHASVADLPEPPDASFIRAPREATIETVRELAEAGAGRAVCYAAGFAEIDGGAAYQDRLIEAAGDLAAMGPNRHGLVNFVDRAAVWPAGFAKASPARGPALVAQSGNEAVLAVARFAEDRRGRLIELDVNPLMVRPRGRGAVAVDAVIRIADE